MKTRNNLEKYLKEDLIESLYENDLYLAEILPKEKEYYEISKELVKLSAELLDHMEEKMKRNFIEYVENVNIKESIEAKHQFVLGFKIAIKLIIEGLE